MMPSPVICVALVCLSFTLTSTAPQNGTYAEEPGNNTLSSSKAPQHHMDHEDDDENHPRPEGNKTEEVHTTLHEPEGDIDTHYHYPNKKKKVSNEDHGRPGKPSYPPGGYGYPQRAPGYPGPGGFYPPHAAVAYPHPQVWYNPYYGGGPPTPRFMKKMDERDTALHNRRRRRDTSSWWNDIDSGRPNEVSNYLAERYSSVAARNMMQQAMAEYGPPTHVGTIDRGMFVRPELNSAVGDRSFGYNPDFNRGDMTAFAFRPQGQRLWRDEADFRAWTTSQQGKPYNQEFVFHNGAVSGDSRVYQGGSWFNPNSPTGYWTENQAALATPATYKLDMYHTPGDVVGSNPPGDVDSYLFVRDSKGRTVAASNLDYSKLQMANPFSEPVNIHGQVEAGSATPEVTVVWDTASTSTTRGGQNVGYMTGNNRPMNLPAWQ